VYTELFKENEHFLLSDFSGKNTNLILDVGANEGYYTLKIKKNNPRAKIVAVEPNPLAFELLEKNIKSNKMTDVILVNKAIGPKTEKGSFEVVEQVNAICGKNVNNIKRPWLKKEMIKKIVVDYISLEKLCSEYRLETINILKLDVEGMETEILKSSKNLLDKIQRIVVEYHSEKSKKALKKYMKNEGFTLLFEEKKTFGDLYFSNDSFLSD
jgi:FkbM family methyltransferase